MGNTINFSETLIIALGAMAIILAVLILYAISLVAKLSKAVGESQLGNNIGKDSAESFVKSHAATEAPVQTFNDNDEEDRLVAALAASALASEDKSGSHFKISKITRIK
jgi:glutaconyl-CoA/methylmalonyl-CoA decarboxylase subunit delta